MLITFAYCIRRRPSGTGNNEPQASLIPPDKSGSLVWSFQAANPKPARMNDISFRPAGRTEETRRLIRQREHTAHCWQLCCSTPITGGVAPGMPPNLNCFRRNRYAPSCLALHLSHYALPPRVSRLAGFVKWCHLELDSFRGASHSREACPPRRRGSGNPVLLQPISTESRVGFPPSRE